MSVLLDQLRNKIRLRHYSIHTEHACRDWLVRYVKYHNLRHPAEMGVAEIGRFLAHLAVEGNVAGSTQNHRAKGLAPRGFPQGGQSCFSSVSCTR